VANTDEGGGSQAPDREARRPVEHDSPLSQTFVSGPASAPRSAKGEVKDARTGAVPLLPAKGMHVGRHLVLRELGHGAMGVVYQAYDPELDRRIAVKLLHSGKGVGIGSTDADDDKTRLRREAQAMARLAHPNVVAVHDVGEHAGQVFMAMEYVDGITLRDYLETPKPWREVLEVMLDAGRGLAAAHAKGLIHRDFKPENVMVGKDGRPRVMDFGLARTGKRNSEPIIERKDLDLEASALDTGLTHAGAILGTPRYMAPEQFLGEEIDARSDQFSYCIALYEAVYEQMPFAGESVASIAFNVSQGKVLAPPRSTEVPGWVHKAILRGLNIDPHERWPSMNELISALDRNPVRRVGWIGVVGLAAVSVGVGVFLGMRAGPSPCPDAAPQLAPIWSANSPSRERMRSAFTASGLGHAPATFERVAERLDAYSSAWVKQRNDACEATRVRGEQSETLLDLRVACLDGRRQQLAALTEVLTDADADVVQRSLEAVEGLSPLASCSNRERLLQKQPMPEDPVTVDRIESLQRKLARAEALNSAGKYDDALALANELVEGSADIEYGPLRVDARRVQASAIDKFGRVDDSAEAHAAVFELAILHDRDFEAAEAALSLTEIVGVDLKQAERGEVWLSVAAILRDKLNEQSLDVSYEATAASLYSHTERLELALEHQRRAVELAEDGLSKARMQDQLGTVLTSLGHLDEALEVRREATETFRRIAGPEHPETARRILNEGTTLFSMRRIDEAAERFEQVTALAETAFEGPNTLVADGYVNLAIIEADRGQAEAAIDHLEVALTIYDELGSNSHPNVRRILINLGAIEVQLERFDAAQARFDRVLALVDDVDASVDPEVGALLTNYGDLLTAQGQYEAALDKQQQAYVIMTKAMGADSAWVAYPLHGKAEALVELGRHGEAEAPARSALAIRQELGALPQETGYSHYLLARALWGLGRKSEARRELDAALLVLADARVGSPATDVRSKVETWARSQKIDL